MRILYLDWPHLPYRLAGAASAGSPAGELVVVGGQPWEGGTVLDCSPAAARLGVRRGQPLGTAHKLVPEARFVSPDLAAHRARLEVALEVLARFTPALEADADPAGATFGQCWLGIEGLHLLWGDEPVLVRQVMAAVEPLLPGRPRAGVGNTRFGAQVAAVVGGARRRRSGAGREEASEAIPAGGAAIEAEYLAPLPVRLLPADDATRERLRVLGVSRIGELARIARSAVIARFGEHGGFMHDLARGLDSRPLHARLPIERLRADVELDPPAEQLEPLRFVLRHLCAALCAQLSARGAGAGEATLELELEGAAPLVLAQALPEPAAAAPLIERLLLARLEANLPTQPVARLALELQRTAPAAGQQLGLFTPQLARAARLDWQLAGLALRYGADRFLQARLVDAEASLPEQRIEWRRATSQPLATVAPVP